MPSRYYSEEEPPVDPPDPGDGGDGGGGAVSYPPVVATGSLPNGSIGTAYSQTLEALYGTGIYTWAITVGSLPPGLNLTSATGVIAGTPTTAGSYSFVVTVTDSSSATASANLNIYIPSQPQIVNSSLPNGTVGVPYTAGFSGTGGAAPYTFLIEAGDLPPGLTLASTGGITGTPTTQGTFSFTVEITDSAGTPVSNSANFSITIAPLNLAGEVTSLDECVLLGCSDGGLYMVQPGQRHDQDYNGNPLGFLQKWNGVPTPAGRMQENQLGGATIGAKGAGQLNVSVTDDRDHVTMLSSVQRPMVLSATETTRDFMAKAVPKSVRYAPCLDNGGVVDAYFEAHVCTLWMRPFFTARKA